MGLFGALSLILYRYLLPEDAFDPMWQRIGLAIFFGFTVLLSIFFETYFYRNMEKLVTVSLYLISIWILQLNWLNNLRAEYSLSYFVVLFACVVVFSRKEGLLYFSIFNLVLATIVSILTYSPAISPFLFIGMVTFLLVVSNTTFGYFMRAFKNMEQSAETYHSLSEAALAVNRDGIVVVNDLGQIEDINAEMGKLWNIKLDGLKGLPLANLAKELASQLRDPNQLRKKEEWAFPLAPSNSTRFALHSGKIIEMETQNISIGQHRQGTALFFHDQTRSHLQQREIDRSTALIRATFELSGLGILVTDQHGKVIFHNDIYLRLFNMTEDFLTLSAPQEVIQYCQKQLKNTSEVASAMDKLIREPQFEETRLLEFLNGRLVQRMAQRMELEGKVIGRVWFYRDMTERIKAEEELVRRNFELDSFVYSASHDLKAPLNSLSGLLRLAKEEFTEPEMAKFLAMMSQNVTRLEDFIGLLTDFSRNQRMDILHEPVELQEIVEEIKGKLRFMKESEHVELKLVNNLDAPLYTDPPRIRILLTNLIANSYRYFDPQQAHPFVHIKVGMEGKSPVIWVEDNGQGIPAHLQGKIFDLFFRANAKSTGSGMGLYVVRNTIARMGGTISLDETYQGGTRFKIVLPQMQAENKAG
jgi:PAS domain S-box-containing protein